MLAYRDPLQQIVYENYMTVRALLDFLKQWIDERIDDIAAGRIANPEKTMAWYWLKNAGNGEHFSKKDIVFECFHNFVAFSQWGNTIFGIMSRLSEDGGDPDVRAAFQKTMSGDYDNANGAPYTPLELFVMELFRTISPNGGSISAIERCARLAYGASPHERFGVPLRAQHLHQHAAHHDQHRSRALEEPEQFDPDRYRACRPAPRSTRPNAGRSALPAARSTSRRSR